ncbi:hypothetical protein INS49_010453 [Diaporthe citri]|uniref:uncharacterized protein n=1 Tax=Diaporthe citri TaxID=83186 RepID=UPI001C809A4D|nr:uncharacterized protein INS49_010453 [Diaporthe citri]KAG6362223.1 hypothetical protein INS49_010453 [Diaporthe citri]
MSASSMYAHQQPGQLGCNDRYSKLRGACDFRSPPERLSPAEARDVHISTGDSRPANQRNHQTTPRTDHRNGFHHLSHPGRADGDDLPSINIPGSPQRDQKTLSRVSLVYSLVVLFQPANVNGGLLQNWVEVDASAYSAVHDMEFARMTVWFRGLQTGYWSTNSGLARKGEVAQKYYEDDESYDKQHHQ